ncbi:MAG: PAS domain-containing sensor histidine kinase [Proteobacteria bacterium]|nr:PAS domain-containing sensor histidine kinase [Pseudomonadota bacterium]
MAEPLSDLERLLIESRNKFRALFDGIEDQIMSIDPDFKIVMANNALALAVDRKPASVIGETCHRLIYGFDRPCPENGLPCPAILSQRTRRFEFVQHDLSRGPGLENKPRYFEIRSMPVFDENGRPQETILVRRDVTTQRLAEIQIRRYNEHLEEEVEERTRDLVEINVELTRQRNDLEEVNQKLEHLQILKQDLTNMVIHDLKGPLSEILANLEMMKMEDLSEFQGEAVEAAEMGGQDLMRMITNLLDISRMEEDRLILEIHPFDAGALIEQARDRYTPQAQLSEVLIEAELPSGLPELEADPNLFERILNNLISNALDYTPSEGRITLVAWLDADRFRIEVRDTGRGIPEELQSKIFDKFSQGKDGRPKTSSGLGLTFCKMAVEAHGGRIWVESEPGRGSRFIFTVPINSESGQLREAIT